MPADLRGMKAYCATVAKNHAPKTRRDAARQTQDFVGSCEPDEYTPLEYGAARGPEGIRIPCCAFPGFDDTQGDIAQRLAARRTVGVRGYRDEPRNVELLIDVARDPSRDERVRREAIVSLCGIEAPEAMDLLIRTVLDPREVDRLR